MIARSPTTGACCIRSPTSLFMVLAYRFHALLPRPAFTTSSVISVNHMIACHLSSGSSDHVPSLLTLLPYPALARSLVISVTTTRTSSTPVKETTFAVGRPAGSRSRPRAGRFPSSAWNCRPCWRRTRRWPRAWKTCMNSSANWASGSSACMPRPRCTTITWCATIRFGACCPGIE